MITIVFTILAKAKASLASRVNYDCNYAPNWSVIYDHKFTIVKTLIVQATGEGKWVEVSLSGEEKKSFIRFAYNFWQNCKNV